MKEQYRKGAKVRFKSQIDLDIWNVTQHIGSILEVRGYGPSELMVTAQFGKDRIHIAHTHLEVVDE
jgi:hypothetical protein